MQTLHYLVKVNVVARDKHVSMDCLPASDGGVVGTPDAFFLAAWIGGGNEDMSFEKINSDGTVEVRHSIKENDPNTVKLAVYCTNIPSDDSTHKIPRCNHIATAFMSTSDLLQFLSNKTQITQGSAEHTPENMFIMRDNFSRNHVIISGFQNMTTNVKKVAALPLRNSVLNRLSQTNATINELGALIEQKLSKCVISTKNAGVQYVSGFTFMPMNGVVHHYGLLNKMFSNTANPIDLTQVMYSTFQTISSCRIHPNTLLKMSDKDLVIQFGNNVISAMTSCPRTFIYASDKTLDEFGNVTKLTEDMQASLTEVAIRSQGVTEPYKRQMSKGGLGSNIGASMFSLSECVDRIHLSLVNQTKPSNKNNTRGGCLVLDDCENEIQAVEKMFSAFPKVTLACNGTIACLVEQMKTVASKDISCSCDDEKKQSSTNIKGNYLFPGQTTDSLRSVAALIIRLGSLVNQKVWDMSMAVVSAKGGGNTICGHAAGLSSVTSEVQNGDQKTIVKTIVAVEGTTWMAVSAPPQYSYQNHSMSPQVGARLATQPPQPKRYVSKIPVRMEDWSKSTMNISEFWTVLGQTMHRFIGVSKDTRIMSQIPLITEPIDGDILKESQFYLSVFYTGLSQNSDAVGCVPLEMRPNHVNPVFGAPVMGLSLQNVYAIPVYARGKVSKPGLEAASEQKLEQTIIEQAKEIFPPRASEKSMNNILSFWQPIRPESYDNFNTGIGHGCAQICETLEDPAEVEMLTAFYDKLAAKFNQLQRDTPGNDGAVMYCYPSFRGVRVGINMPIPIEDEPWTLTCVRNLTLVASNPNIQKIIQNPLKMAHIASQASKPSNSHFYMCSQGNGFVHSYKTRLV